MVAKTFQHKHTLHKWSENGGMIRFKNFPFAIKLERGSGPFCELQLVAIPTGVSFDTYLNKGSNKAKKKTKQIKLQEEETIEM